MTTLSPPPTAYNTRPIRSPHRLPTPPTAFSTSPGRRTRADSPSPMNLQKNTRPSARKDASSSDEEEFPPSISQRRVPARVSSKAQVEKGRLMLPAESSHHLKEKRSFERTRKWAEEAEEVRRARLAEERYEETEGSLEGLVSDRSSPVPPRTPSPAPSPRGPPQLSLTFPSEKQAPVLSIDDIVRQHSASAQTAMSAAKARARRELGLAPSPDSSAPSTPMLAPSTPQPAAVRRLSGSPPEIPARKSSSPAAKVHVVPSRSSSIGSPSVDLDRQVRIPSSPLHTPSRLGRTTPIDQDTYPTPPATQRRQTQTSLAPTHSNRSHTALPSPATDKSSTSRPASVRSSPAPPSISPAKSHEMALLIRSAPLNNFLTFPRPFPDRPLTVSYADVGKPDGMPVLMFLGVGCVRYLVALYDQVALLYGLRIICVDRWGYGKTDQVDQVERNPIEWSGVILQVVEKLGIAKFQIVAHSAGAPYAMAVARRYPEKIRGKIHLVAPWIGQEHDTALSKVLKWVPGPLIRAGTAADHRLQTYVMGRAPKLQYAPISYNARVTPPLGISPSTEPEPPVEELLEATKPTSLIRRASTVFSGSSKPRRRSIYGTAASTSTVNLSLPFASSTPPSIRRAGSTRSPTPSPDKADTMSIMGRSPGLKNIAAMRSARALSAGPPSSDSRGTSSSAPSSDMLVTPDQSMAISASELDFGLGEGFGSFATDLGLAMPVPKAMATANLGTETTESMSRSTSGTLDDPAVPDPESESLPEPVPPSRFPASPPFSVALSQASHAECEPGTTSDILRIIVNKPHRSWGFRYEDVKAPSHVWIGEEDRLISKESIQFMEDVCGSTVERVAGEGHNLMSDHTVTFALFKCLGEEAREGKRKEEEEERERIHAMEMERRERWRAEGAQRNRRW